MYYRPLKGKELLSLKGKLLNQKENINIYRSVIDFDIYKDVVRMTNEILTSEELLEKYIYEDKTPIGIEVKEEYLTPLPSWIGRMKMEVADILEIPFATATIIGISKEMKFITVSNSTYIYAKIKKFTPNNPPPRGVRFTCGTGICDINIIRYTSATSGSLIADEYEEKYNYEDVNFIDFKPYETNE